MMTSNRRSVLGNGDRRQDSEDSAESALADLLRLLDAGTLSDAESQVISDSITTIAAMIHETRAERLRYDSLFNALPDPVSIIDAEGRFLDLTQACLDASLKF